jgi:hypothetical protein
MLSKFWESVGSRLVDRWASVAGPAVVFWLGGLLARTWHVGGLTELADLTDGMSRQSTLTQVALVLVLLSAVLGSALVVDRLSAPALRLLEGYWPFWTDPLRHRMISRVTTRSEVDQQLWQHLTAELDTPDRSPTASELSRYARLERRLHHLPATPDRLLPTRIGNILRSAETRSTDKYALDAVVAWPRLWLLMPDVSRQELTAARARLDAAVSGAVWGVLFCGFSLWTPLVIPVGLGVAAAAVWFWIPGRAETFGDLVDAAFDVHRTLLYRHLRWPLPTDPRDERVRGEALTAYLWRGSDDPEPTFTEAT